MSIKAKGKKIYDGDNLLLLSDIRYLPRWIILAIDAFILFVALILSYFLIQKLNVTPPDHWFLEVKFLFIISINCIFMFVFRTYAGIIRHSNFIDLFKLFLATMGTLITLLVFNYVCFFTLGYKFFLTPIFFIYAVLSFSLLFSFRLVVKESFHYLRELRSRGKSSRILVIGIDESAVAIAGAIIENPNIPFEVSGFLTDRKDSKRARLLGKPIITLDTFQTSARDNLELDGILVIRELLTSEELNSIVNTALEKDLKVYKAPSLQKFRTKDLATGIKAIQIEDLLNRRPISIVNNDAGVAHENKVVLITGGAGSIGSEIVRQVAKLNPKKVIILDQAETPLHEIELEVLKSYPSLHFEFILADISNKVRLQDVFEEFKIDMVYHAAAYKHVPLIEKNPHEAVLVNILGTKNLASLSSSYQVKHFIMISTDKAVNPTNIMGASKRAAELYVQALQAEENNTTKFITTRFGNVLGSNGSVIPHFKKQIESGGPITVTHKDIVRYFMTIPEACELVLQAGTMGQGGEIFVFDMGEPVKIADLARRMIKLSGLTPDLDIEIVYTGLRPGEKLFEELLSDGTKTLPTHHGSIMISKDPCLPFQSIDTYFQHLIQAAQNRDKVALVQILKNMVPEFKSQNSTYSELDV